LSHVDTPSHGCDSPELLVLRREVICPAPRIRQLAEALSIVTFVVVVFTGALAAC
jgi:hypothetical protein